MKIILLVASTFLPVWAFGAGEDKPITEKWRCLDHLAKGEAVRLTRVGGRGRVVVAGVAHPAMFRVQGIDRRWDFGDDFQYAFIIRPSKRGSYYDFSMEKEKVKPSQLFECRGP